METNARIRQIDIPGLELVKYPDPRLREMCVPVDEVDDVVRALAERMFEIMFESRGVGLAATQVGVAVRLFVASPTFDLGDRRVYINPRIVDSSGTQDGEEGCLSFPGISCKVKRGQHVVVEAVDLAGRIFTEEADELAARICQHEIDHLDGRLLVDRMGTVAKLANRRSLRDLEKKFSEA